MLINIGGSLALEKHQGGPMGLQEASGGFRRAQEAQPRGGVLARRFPSMKASRLSKENESASQPVDLSSQALI